jgi:4-amino-4-deoxy-L-arabinose transferase-like glycosyltransferase
MLTAILVVALGVRLLAALWWQQRLGDPRGLGFPDSYSYWDLGQRLAAGQPYEYGGPDFRVFRAPGFPLLLAAYFAVAGDDPSVLGARVVGALLGVVTVVGVMWLARLLFDVSTSWWAGVLAAVYPGAVASSIFVLAEALFCPLMVVQLAAWVAAWQSRGRRALILWAALAGVAGGLATLTRPSWLLFTPAVVLCYLALGRSKGRHAALGCVMLATLTLSMVPWWVRNYRAVGQFVPTTLQVGASLYDGWNARATGASDMAFAAEFYRAQKADDAAAGRDAQGFEVRLDRRLHAAAVAWARAHPREVGTLMIRKFIRMWNLWPNADELRSATIRWVVAAGFVPVLLLGAGGAWISVRTNGMVWLCVLPAAYFTGLHMVFASSIRYREPALLVWIVLAAAVLSADGSGWRASRRTAVVAV